MTLRQVLSQAEAVIASEGIPEARLEAEVLLRHVLGIGRAELYTRFGEPLSPQGCAELGRLVERRRRHEPSAYIVNHHEFFGRDFFVDSRSFIPRPETELLVEAAVEFASNLHSCLIADVGTGSGAIAIALALHLPQAARIYAIDLSPVALEVAAINCQKHRVADKVQLVQGDLLQPLPEPADLIVANLPYIKDSEWGELIPEIRDFEPKTALVGGKTGLEKIRELLCQAPRLCAPGVVLLEIGLGEGEEVVALARSYFPHSRVDLLPDLCGIDRVMRIVAP